MNKILLYFSTAILLGSVTMIVPYLLLGSSDYTTLDGDSTLIQPSTTDTEPYTEANKLDSQDRASSEGGTLVNDEPETPKPALTETDLLTRTLSNLPPVGLIIIPSFLIAFGAFIYLKKRS